MTASSFIILSFNGFPSECWGLVQNGSNQQESAISRDPSIRWGSNLRINTKGHLE
jgi:hypothetical protein